MYSTHSFRLATRFIALVGLVAATACADSGEPLTPEAPDAPRFGNTLIGSGNSVQHDTVRAVAAGGNSGGGGASS